MDRVYLARLSLHVKQWPNFNRFQLAYRRGRNSKTALRMLNDVYLTADRGSRTMLLQLDLLSAFDTLDISMMLRRLVFPFRFSGPALNWISSYMAHRKQLVLWLQTRCAPRIRSWTHAVHSVKCLFFSYLYLYLWGNEQCCSPRDFGLGLEAPRGLKKLSWSWTARFWSWSWQLVLE